MADISAVYTLVTPGGTIVFNSGATDSYYLTEVQGLDGVALRTPIDPAPWTDGALVHDFWEDARHPLLEGVLFIQSVAVMNSILTIRNDMEEDLRVALASIKRADGTLAWTPLGQSARTLTVRNDVPLEMRHIENFLLRSFAFGLVAADPSW